LANTVVDCFSSNKSHNCSNQDYNKEVSQSVFKYSKKTVTHRKERNKFYSTIGFSSIRFAVNFKSYSLLNVIIFNEVLKTRIISGNGYLFKLRTCHTEDTLWDKISLYIKFKFLFKEYLQQHIDSRHNKLTHCTPSTKSIDHKINIYKIPLLSLTYQAFTTLPMSHRIIYSLLDQQAIIPQVLLVICLNSAKL